MKLSVPFAAVVSAMATGVTAAATHDQELTMKVPRVIRSWETFNFTREYVKYTNDPSITSAIIIGQIVHGANEGIKYCPGYGGYLERPKFAEGVYQDGVKSTGITGDHQVRACVFRSKTGQGSMGSIPYSTVPFLEVWEANVTTGDADSSDLVPLQLVWTNENQWE